MNRPFFSSERVNDSVTAIRSACGEILYLIEGRDRAILVDSNLGVKGLRALTESLTHKPYSVVLTHGHIDHAMGAPEFHGVDVYLNHKDIPVYRGMCALEGRKGYIGPLVKELEMTDDDFVPEEPDFPFLDLQEGMVFDLGGLHAEIYAFPGHTPGSVVILLPESGTLITGDACNSSTFLFDPSAPTILEYQQTVRRVKEKLAGRYERVWISHHVMEAAPDLLGQMDELCDEILQGETDDVPFDFMGNHAVIAKRANERFERADGKYANLIYRKDNIR